MSSAGTSRGPLDELERGRALQAQAQAAPLDAAEQSELDAILSRSFGAAAADYDRYRKGPPAEAIDWLVPRHAREVVDLGAGTGVMTRALIARGYGVVAVDPDPRMRSVLSAARPAARIVEGTGERIPVPDASQDAVLAAASWHWVDPGRAIPEVARVLRSGGRLGLIWSGIDRDSAVMAELWAHMRPQEQNRAVDRGRWRLDLPPGGPFLPAEGLHQIRWREPFTHDELVGYARTLTTVIMLAPVEREAWLDRFRTWLEHALPLAVGSEFEIPMIGHCLRADRI
jgi:SAM-dependent methyltransferase